VRANAHAARLQLSDEDLATIDAAFAAPQRKVPLQMV
jgi:diketogulonate reductase-like aldo/keto reductase